MTEELAKKEEEIMVQKKENPLKKKLIPIVSILGFILVILGTWYYLEQQKYIYTENAEMSAPLIKLTAREQGTLKATMVEENTMIPAHTAVARVGLELLYSEVGGRVVTAKKDFGAIYKPGDAVVTMVDPMELHVVARIDENKGLREIHAGQKVLFTVDAYGSTEFEGVVESVSPSKREGDVVFNISDKREIKQFEIKIAYDHAHLPDFQNGMSARVWIIKD